MVLTITLLILFLQMNLIPPVGLMLYHLNFLGKLLLLALLLRLNLVPLPSLVFLFLLLDPLLLFHLDLLQA